jgi:hypothetical protein
MAASGFTPIQLYRTTTAAAVPVNTNLADGELAINTTDEKLYFKNAAGTVKLLASTAGAAGDVAGPGSATDSALAAFDGTTGKLIKSANLTANNVLLGNGTGAPQVVAPGTAGNVLTSNGTTWASSPAAATGVTSLSVATANGFAGTSSGGSTPIITMTTSITGLLQGNGTAVSAVTIGSGLTFSAGTLSASSSTAIGLVRAVAINCILP